MKKTIKNYVIFILFTLLLVVIDQASKVYIINHVEYGSSLYVIEDFFYITRVYNEGAAWSILEGQTAFFILISIIAAAFIIFSVIRSNSRVYDAFAAVFLGGLIGNLIDRIYNEGKVIDFLGFHIFNYDFPVFNFADICLVVGTVLLVVFLLWDEDKNGRKNINNR